MSRRSPPQRAELWHSKKGRRSDEAAKRSRQAEGEKARRGGKRSGGALEEETQRRPGQKRAGQAEWKAPDRRRREGPRQAGALRGADKTGSAVRRRTQQKTSRSRCFFIGGFAPISGAALGRAVPGDVLRKEQRSLNNAKAAGKTGKTAGGSAADCFHIRRMHSEVQDKKEGQRC